MGCDIHVHVEVKVRGRWLHWDLLSVTRDYDLFEKMAGVRGKVSEAISPPRGLPADVSETTKLDAEIWGRDGHSHSWLSSKEVVEVEEWWIDNSRPGFGSDPSFPGYVGGLDYGAFVLCPQDRAKEIEDFRFVFWFDN